MSKDKLPLRPGSPERMSKPTKASRSGKKFGKERVSGADGEGFDVSPGSTKQVSVGKEKRNVS